MYKLKSPTHNKLPESVLRQHLLLLSTGSRLTLLRRAEEQTRSLHRLKQMAQIPPMRRITIILDIPTTRRIRQSVPESTGLHHIRLGKFLRGTVRLQQVSGARLGSPRHRDKGMGLLRHDVSNGGARVESRCDGSAGCFDGCDCRCGDTGDDEVDGLFEDSFTAA